MTPGDLFWGYQGDADDRPTLHVFGRDATFRIVARCGAVFFEWELQRTAPGLEICPECRTITGAR